MRVRDYKWKLPPGTQGIVPHRRTWYHMIRRCTNPHDSGYKDYGGRGITVCERWADSFENFLVDMGPKPTVAHSLDRIDNDGNYEPGNCRWATAKQQANNSRRWADKTDIRDGGHGVRFKKRVKGK